MQGRWLAGFVLAVMLLDSSAASADPSSWAQLTQIILWLERIDQTLPPGLHELPHVAADGALDSDELWSKTPSVAPPVHPHGDSFQIIY